MEIFEITGQRKGGGILSLDLIRDIAETEDIAAGIRKRAQEDEKRILAAAGAGGLKLVQKATEEVKKQAEVMDEEKEIAAGLQVERVREQVDKECRIIKENAVKILDQIAEELVERVVNKYVGR